MTTAGGATWATAAPISVGATSDPTPVSGTTTTGSRPDNYAWWTVTSGVDGILSVNTSLTTGTYPDTQIDVYTGTDEASAVLVVSNDEFYPDNDLSRASWAATAGTTYHVRASQWGGTVDTYVLTVEPISDHYLIAPGGDVWFGSGVPNAFPAQTDPLPVSGYTDDTESLGSYGLHRGAFWYWRRIPTATKVAFDCSASTGNLANVGLFVRSLPPGSDGASWAGTTPVADNLAHGGPLLVTLNVDTTYVIGMGVKVDDGSTTDYVLNTVAPFAGDWQTDADLSWASAGHVQTATANSGEAIGVSQTQTGSNQAGYPYGDWAGALAEAWTHNDSCVATTSSHVGPQLYVADILDYMGNPSGTNAYWWAQWLTLVTQSVTVNSSTLPSSVYANGAFVDPNVIGVEWEPTSTPVDQKLSVKLMGSNGASFVLGEQYYLHGPTPYAGSAPYAPGYLTAAAVSGTPTLGQITGASDPNTQGGVGGSVEIADLSSLPLTGGTYAMPLILLDQYTETQTSPSYNPGSYAARFPQFTADLMRAFQPRYRLLYAAPPSPPPPPSLNGAQTGDRRVFVG